MWKAVTAILILALIAAGAVFVLPTVVEERIVDALKQQTAAEDVQISITDSPRLVFGEIDPFIRAYLNAKANHEF